MNSKRTEAIEWLRYVLNPVDTVPSILNWKDVYNFCDKQKIGGVCEPTRFDVHVDDEVLLDWIALVRQLQSSNYLLNERVCQLFQKLQDDGLRCCLLKGQGNAEMYPDPNLRTPGDIDVWIDADEKTINSYVLKQFPDAMSSFKHIKYPLFSDIPVDVHQTPLKLKNPFNQCRLQRWIEENKEEQFVHKIRLHDTYMEIAVPTAQFNAVYQMGHIMIHFFDEGIGLRQLIDYFFVLKNLENVSEAKKNEIRKAWKRFGMARLASAVMWIEREVLGLPENLLLITPNERWGRRILADTLEGGNFGKFRQRQSKVGLFRLKKRIATLKRLVRLSSCMLGETVFRLLFDLKAVIIKDLNKIIR